MRLSIALFKFFISSATLSALVLAPVTAASAPVTASAALSQLSVKTWSSHSGYARTKFSDGWGKIGSCDLRNYILKRDMTSIVWRSGETCIVQTGTLKDPYTGSTIYFVRGVGTSLAVQIDHVVALSNAWVTGASALPSATRYKIYNDPLNLLAVDGPTNESKSDSDAADWLPPRIAYRCSYVARQIAVKRKYKLWVTSSEKAAMRAVLNTCPGKALPTS